MQTKTLNSQFSILNLTTWVLLVVTGAFMAVLDTTVVDIIVPRLKGPLSTDMYGVQWVITAYMIAAAVGLLIVEWLIKRFGNKWIYIISVAVFTAASFLCGISNSLSFIIIARVLQGFAEAMIMVTAQAMLFSFFPPEKRGIAMGIFALGVAFAPAIGPTLGGYLTDWFSWRAVFFVNVPIGIVLVIFSALLLPDNSEKTDEKLNFVSVAFLTVATVALLTMLSKGQQYGWFNSSFIVYLGFGTFFGTLFFIMSEYYSSNSLFDYTLFKNPYYALGILVYFVLLGFSMYQYFYLIPMFYEHIKGLSSIQTGLGVLGFGIWIGVFSMIAGALSDRFSPVPVLITGAVIYLISSFVLFPSINYYTPFWEAVLKTMPFGIAMGLFFAPITVLVMNNSNGKIEQGIMTMDYVRFIGGSFGTAIATNNLVFYSNKEFDSITVFQNFHMVRDAVLGLENFFGDTGAEIFRRLEEFASADYGFKYVWLDAAFWGLMGSLFVFALLFVKKRKVKGTI
jgi:DHA2 family multidrug resistance protein